MNESITKSKNWLEWLVFGLGLILCGGVAGFLIYEMATASPGESPHLEVTLGSPRAKGTHFEVPVTVRNRGDETAEGLTVEVRLTKGERAENSSFELPYVPPHSTRHGMVLFETDPVGAELRARPVGYENP